MQRIECQPAYILHRRPYRETSQILELLTRDYGRIGVVAKGVRRTKSVAKGVLQPFIPLLISCAGKGELLTLTGFDAVGIWSFPSGSRLVSAFYVNELLIRLLHRFDVNQDLFQIYGQTLRALGQERELQEILRLFEKSLLKTLGYGLQLGKDVKTGETVGSDGLYAFDPSLGPQLVSEIQQGIPYVQQGIESKQSTYRLFKGKSLLALDQEKLTSVEVLSDAKRLMRQALAPHLGTKPLESRRLL